MKTIALDENEVFLIIMQLADLTNFVPDGLDPTFYKTGSYEGDSKLKSMADAIINKLKGEQE